jgi:hypothetical protein
LDVWRGESREKLKRARGTRWGLVGRAPKNTPPKTAVIYPFSTGHRDVLPITLKHTYTLSTTSDCKWALARDGRNLNTANRIDSSDQYLSQLVCGV